MSISGRTFCLVSLVAAASVLCGCAPTEVGLFDEDAAALDRVRNIRIKVTTISGVTGEDYPEIAWHNIARGYERPYYPLTEGQLFGWAFLDDLAKERREAGKRAEQPAKKKRKAKRKPKREPKRARKDEAKAEAKVESEKKPAEKPEEQAEEPKRSRRSRRSRGD